ncbi:MAG: thiamine diphosphokinase [Clostridia bacterium]|nr:thiamine diphosphokinase [Clostridia bacterium]
MKKAAIILSQPFTRYRGADFVICADAGYKRALALGIKPDLLVGDMDSLGYEPENVSVYRVPNEKDFSDGELAVRQAALRNHSSIDIYGGVGGRIDHTLYNLHLLKLADSLGVKAVLRGDDFDVYYTQGKLLLDVKEGDTLSIVPFSDRTHIMKAKGLKYPADGAVLTKSDTLGLSNVCMENSVYIVLKEGSALIVHYYR